MTMTTSEQPVQPASVLMVLTPAESTGYSAERANESSARSRLPKSLFPRQSDLLTICITVAY